MTPRSPDASAAFRATYAAHRDAVWRYALRRLGDRDAAEDVTTEVFVVAWRRHRDVPAEPLPWLYGVARKLVANHRRGAARRGALHERAAASAALVQDDPAGAVGEREALARALARLSPADREVVLLVAWEGLQVHELAVVLGCRRSAAGVRLHRARRRLRAALQAEGAAPPATAPPPSGPAPAAPSSPPAVVYDLGPSDPALSTPSSTR